MAWVPSHKVYQSDGVTLKYTIEDVIRREPMLNISVPDFVEHQNIRSAGSIIIPGGNQPYDITIYARLAASNYEGLMTAFESIQTLIAVNTNYVLKIDKSSTTTEDVNVMRLQPIVVDTGRGNLTRFLYYTLTLRAGVWH